MLPATPTAHGPPVVDGLVLPQHFVELSDVLELLTTPDNSCLFCSPCDTNPPAALVVSVALNCEGEPDPLCAPLDANPEYGDCTANDKAEITFVAAAGLTRSPDQGRCGWRGDIGTLTLKTGGGAVIGAPVGIHLQIWWDGNSWQYRWSGTVETDCGEGAEHLDRIYAMGEGAMPVGFGCGTSEVELDGFVGVAVDNDVESYPFIATVQTTAE